MKLKALKPHVISARVVAAGDLYELQPHMAKIMIAAGLAEKFRAERKRRAKTEDEAAPVEHEEIEQHPPSRTYERRDMVAQ
jgi:hypothetical protein